MRAGNLEIKQSVGNSGRLSVWQVASASTRDLYGLFKQRLYSSEMLGKSAAGSYAKGLGRMRISHQIAIDSELLRSRVSREKAEH